jgi:hypothetical protein
LHTTNNSCGTKMPTTLTSSLLNCLCKINWHGWMNMN